MMNKPGDRCKPKLPHTLQSLVRPTPRRITLMPLPQQTYTETPNAEFRDVIQVVDSVAVTREFHLVEISVSNTIARVLDSTPHFRLDRSRIVER